MKAYSYACLIATQNNKFVNLFSDAYPIIFCIGRMRQKLNDMGDKVTISYCMFIF